MRKLFVAVLACGLTIAARGQAPAGAPSGAMGICKDGSYSMQATKDGACRGHKGVQTWYSATPAKGSGSAKGTTAAPASAKGSSAAPAMPMPMPMPMPAAKTAPAAAAQPAARPAPAPMTPMAPMTPAAPMASGKRMGPAAAAEAKTAAAGGGPGLVWVNTSSNVYHCYGTTYYGKTKAGAYMSEGDAKAKGARGDRGQSCSK